MMRITGRAKKIALFVTLGAILVGLAIALNVWIVLNWRYEVVPLVFAIIFLGLIIAALLFTPSSWFARSTRTNNRIVFERGHARTQDPHRFDSLVPGDPWKAVSSAKAQRREFYRIMLEDTDRLTGTVEQVLKAGKRGKRAIRRIGKKSTFPALFSKLLNSPVCATTCRPKSFALACKPQEKLLMKGNPQELRTAVFNLVENAVKYSGNKKDIVVDVVTPDIDTVILQIRDHGVGIPPSELKRIFKRFYRVSNSASGRVKGTGLGLFIVRSIARRHGGEAFAQSEGSGRGSTFTLRLPRVYHA